MAAPVVESKSFAVTQSGGTVNSLTVTKPSGVAEGDLLVAVLSSNLEAISISGGAAWTLRASVANTGFCRIFTSVAGASEPSSYTIATDDLDNDQFGGTIFRVSGADTSSPVDVYGTNTGTSSTPTAPSITTTVADTLLFVGHALDANRLATPDTGFPTGYTGGRHEQTDSPAACVHGSAYKSQASAGSTGTAAFTCDSSDTWAALQLAIKPAAGGGGPDPITVATETEASLALGSSKALALASAAQTDSALALGSSKVLALIEAIETEAALALSYLKGNGIAAALETELALALGTAKTLSLSVATASEQALALGSSKALAVGLAQETEAALLIETPAISGTPVVTAQESESALALGTAKALAIGVAQESESALTVALPLTDSEMLAQILTNQTTIMAALTTVTTRVNELWQLQGLDPDNATTITELQRTVDDLTLTITKAPDGSVTVSRQ